MWIFCCINTVTNLLKVALRFSYYILRDKMLETNLDHFFSFLSRVFLFHHTLCDEYEWRANHPWGTQLCWSDRLVKSLLNLRTPVVWGIASTTLTSYNFERRLTFRRFSRFDICTPSKSLVQEHRSTSAARFVGVIDKTLLLWALLFPGGATTETRIKYRHKSNDIFPTHPRLHRGFARWFRKRRVERVSRPIGWPGRGGGECNTEKPSLSLSTLPACVSSPMED